MPARTDNLDGQFLADVDIEHIEKCDFLYTMISGANSISMFSIDTRIRTELNALQVGIDVLIRYRSEKKVPERLPFSSPKDLFTEKLFEIIKTEDGFKLKTGDNTKWGGTKISEYEFILPKE